MKFDNLWIRFGCFITGYNYPILSHCSELSKKAVKRYTSAILIILLIWGAVGYQFANRYLKLDSFYSIIVSLIFCVIVIQIERQIILNFNKNKLLYFSRFVIAIAMAIIGAIIIDQIIFKEDVELAKLKSIDIAVDSILPRQTSVVESQIREFDNILAMKEIERANMLADIKNNPFESFTSSVETKRIPGIISGSDGRDSAAIIRSKNVSKQAIPNPNIALLPKIDEEINTIRTLKMEKGTYKLKIRDELKAELLNKNGFLDELDLLVSIVFSHAAAFFIWLIWFILLFFIEMLVLISKTTDKGNDYEDTINHHREIQSKMLGKLKETR